jgi:hypothetical protein
LIGLLEGWWWKVEVRGCGWLYGRGRPEVETREHMEEHIQT